MVSPIYKFASKCHRLLPSLSRDSQGEETFLEPSADKQTGNYDTKVLKPPSLPISTKVKGWTIAESNSEPYIQIFQ